MILFAYCLAVYYFYHSFGYQTIRAFCSRTNDTYPAELLWSGIHGPKLIGPGPSGSDWSSFSVQKKHLTEVITWRHKHALEVLDQKCKSITRFEFFWTKTSKGCIYRHVINSFGCFSGPKSYPCVIKNPNPLIILK